MTKADVLDIVYNAIRDAREDYPDTEIEVQRNELGAVYVNLSNGDQVIVEVK